MPTMTGLSKQVFLYNVERKHRFHNLYFLMTEVQYYILDWQGTIYICEMGYVYVHMCVSAYDTLIVFKDTFSSVTQSCLTLRATPWTTAHQFSLSITNSQSLLKIMSIKSVMPPNHLILCHPLLLLLSIFPRIRVFSSESVLRIRWPKYWKFSFSISPSSEYSRLISFRRDWLDLLSVQGTLKSLLQHHSSKASVLQHPTLTSIHDYWKNHSFD